MLVALGPQHLKPPGATQEVPMPDALNQPHQLPLGASLEAQTLDVLDLPLQLHQDVILEALIHDARKLHHLPPQFLQPFHHLTAFLEASTLVALDQVPLTATLVPLTLAALSQQPQPHPDVTPVALTHVALNLRPLPHRIVSLVVLIRVAPGQPLLPPPDVTQDPLILGVPRPQHLVQSLLCAILALLTRGALSHRALQL